MPQITDTTPLVSDFEHTLDEIQYEKFGTLDSPLHVERLSFANESQLLIKGKIQLQRAAQNLALMS
jgi:hypothetical protein